MQRARATRDHPGSGGILSSSPEDFEVDETLPYAPGGDGTHLFVRIEKRDLTTPEAARRLAAELDPASKTGADGRTSTARPEDRPSWAGLKDRAAVARQWLSLPWPEDRPLPEAREVAPGLRILNAARHRHRLKNGHVASNQFRIRLRAVPAGGLARARATADRLRQVGLPNHFGPQRFGRDGDNASTARAVLTGAQRRPRDRRLEKLLMSALQAELFNQVLNQRLEDESWCKALMGDLMKKHDSGGLFLCEDPAAEQPRVDALAISPTGPMFGRRMRPAQADAGRIEQAVWAEAGIDSGHLRRLGDGTRRPLRIPVDLEIDPAEDGYVASFTLPSGSYATVLLDELVKPAEGAFDRSRIE